MQEFMLLVFNEGDSKSAMTESDHLAFVKKCEAYIAQLKSEKRLIAAQPLVRTGAIVSRPGGIWEQKAFDMTKNIQVGYYHVLARNLDEAVTIARQNPEFEYCSTASVEVRPVKSKEQSTGFSYPKTGA